MLFSRNIPEPDTPKYDYKRIIRRSIMSNGNVDPRQMPSTKHYMRQNIVNAIRQVPPLSEPFVRADIRRHVMKFEDRDLVIKYAMKKIPKA